MNRVIKVGLFILLTAATGFIFALGLYWGERLMGILDRRAGKLIEARSKAVKA